MNGKAGMVIVVGVVLLATSTFAGVNTTLPEIDDRQYEETISFSVTFSQPEILENEIENKKYSVINADNNMMYIRNEGYPLLPYTTKTFILPFGIEIKNVEVKTSEVKTIYVENKIMPSPSPVPFNMEDVHVELKEGEVYESEEAYPSKWITWRAGAGIENGEHVVFLSIHAFPYRYIPQKNEIIYVNEMKINVAYKPVEKQMFQNDVYDLLILAPSEFVNALTPLKEHKENHGIKTMIVSLDEILNSEYFTVNGTDDTEKVKYFIKEAVEQWGIEYVLIVGGFDEFPMRKSWVYDTAERGWIDIPIPTDLYYADIYFANGSFSSWDTNGNGYFGEFARVDGGDTFYDIVDLYPDVYIGRLACENVNEVSTVVDKIINYEENAHGKKWFSRAVMIAGDTSPNDGAGDVDEGIIVTEKSLDYLDGFKSIKLYPSRFIPELKLNTLSITASISFGSGFVHFAGHGNMVAWSTHPHGNEDKWIGQYWNGAINYLVNGDKLPVMRIGACLCGALDYDGESCFAWSFVKHPKGGAIATVASTRLSWGYIGKYVDHGLGGYHGILFFKGYKEGCTPAEMLASAQNEYINTIPMDYVKDSIYDFKTVEEYILFGDPSLRIGGYP